MKDIYAVGNTHFDPVWLWKWDEAMASIRSTFRSALDRMDEDPEFVYSFAMPPVFEWIKEVDPELWADICRRVDEGRWELCEGWWTQPDCFGASGESYARHALMGQRYLMDNFGKYAQTVFNVDSFGHNSATPQILSKSHVRYYCMCRPENYYVPLSSPYFNWRGKDGSVVRAFRMGQYSEIYNKDMPASVEKTEKYLASADCDEMMLYGVTNHGGAPTKQAIADIHKLNENKPYMLKCSSVAGYFEAQTEPSITHEGELLTHDYGPYVNGAFIKRSNRIAEYAVLNAERASLIALELLNRPYPSAKLDACWRDVLFNQFHDILGGASIREAYFDAGNALGRATITADEITQYALQSVTRKIKTPGKNGTDPWNLVVWNLNGKPIHDYIEAEVQWLHEFPAYKGGIALEDGEGKRYACQVIAERSVIDGFRSRFVFKAHIDPCGYKTFRVIQTDEPAVRAVNGTVNEIRTPYFTAVLDGNGCISSLTAGGRAYTDILRPVALRDEGDTWAFNVDGYTEEIGSFTLEEIRLTESGPLRTTVKTTHVNGKSRVSLYYTFYDDADYIDVRYEVDWHMHHAVLKFVMPSPEEITVSSPFFAEKRTDTATDNPMSEWLCMENGGAGVGIISDSVFAYSKRNGNLELSILRSCIYGDLRLCELDGAIEYPFMEQGLSNGRLRMVFYSGERVSRGIEALATAFNNPPIVICEANHGGEYEPQGSFMSAEAEGVILTAWKLACTGDGEIIRLCENAGAEKQAVINRFGEEYSVTLAPYEIKTLKLVNGELHEVWITEDEI